LKPLYLAGLLVSMLGVSVASHAQAIPMAERTGHIQVGAGFSFAIPDYSKTYIKGFTI